MRCLSLQKYQFNIFLLISIYLSNTNIDAFVVNDNDNSYAPATQQKGDINMRDPNFAAKFKCPLLFGVFPDVEDCSKYYLCVYGISRRLPCPPFRHFDKYSRQCISMLLATCDNGEEEKDTSRPDEKITTVKEKTFLCTSIFGTFPHPTDCSKYYTCSFFVPSLKTCPKKKLFDGVKKECRPESEVNCESRNRATTKAIFATTPLYTESTTRETATIPEETTPETTTPEEPTIAEEETTTEVPTGPPETDCDEDDLDCIITETGEIPKWFKCPVELGSHRHPSSKKLFIFCINWKPYVKKCGQDLIYSQEVETCVSPSTKTVFFSINEKSVF